MASQSVFDIVSKIDLQEVKNALDQANKEIKQRFDFRGSNSKITLEGTAIEVISDDEYKLKSVIDILQSKLLKRGISLKALTYQKVEDALGGRFVKRLHYKMESLSWKLSAIPYIITFSTRRFARMYMVIRSHS